MILVIDIGNTNTVLGFMDGEDIRFSSRISTDAKRTSDEYAASLQSIFSLHGLSDKDFDGGILSSVVPSLISVFQSAIKLVLGRELMVVGPGLKTGLNILIDNPKQLGSDLVIGAVAALHKYPGSDLAIIDMGTATTISVVRKNGDFLGGPITPGVRISFDALSAHAAQLPYISFDAPGHVIGTNTIDSMQSGLIYGNAAMMDGLIDRIEAELGNPVKVIATGGLAASIVPSCRRDIICDNDLLLLGLELVYQKNIKTKRG